MKKIILLISVSVLFLIVGFLIILMLQNQAMEKSIDSFEECAASGKPVMESYPRQCAANGQTFVEEIN